MFSKILPAATAAIIVGAIGFGGVSSPAEALTPIGFSSKITTADRNVQPVATKKTVKKKTWVYNSKKHGKRYKYKNAHYRYYYGGYYYSRPWWTIGIGVPGVNVCIGC